MPICEACSAATHRNFKEHGDERFPPVECVRCGAPTSSGGCLLHQVCRTCAERDGVFEGCGEPVARPN